MLSVIPLLALALVLQGAGPEATTADGAIATAPAPEAAASAPADDPIGALVTQAQEEEGEDGAPPEPAAAPPAAATQPSQGRPSASYPDPAAATPAAPQPYAPSPATAGLPGGPQPYTSLRPTPGTVRPIYAQPLVRLPPKPQGLLDGAWTLAGAERGDPLYQFQFNDVGGGSEVEGAWRDMRRSDALIGSGPVSSVGYDGAGVTIRFLEKGAGEMSVVTLRPGADGAWSGELRGRGGSAPVVMRRN